MLSISKEVATSSSLSPVAIWSKKDVGGNCWVSPITTAVLPLINAPNASSGLTWLASSKITTSNCNSSFVGSRYCATDNGLIIKHGFILLMIPPAFSNNFLTGRCPLFLVNSPANILASGFSVAPNICGILLFNFWKILLRFRDNIFLSKSSNSFILFSCNSPINVASSWFSTNKIFNNESAKFPWTSALTSSFLMSLLSIESINCSESVPLQAFLVFKYCDHKWRLDNCPLQLYNCSCHFSKATSPVSLLKISLLLGFNLDSNFLSSLSNKFPDSMYSVKSSLGFILNISLDKISIVFCEKIPSRVKATNSFIHFAISFKSLMFAPKCQ